MNVFTAGIIPTEENEPSAKRNANTVVRFFTPLACAPTSPPSTTWSLPRRRRAVSPARARRREGRWRPSCPPPSSHRASIRRSFTPSHRPRRRASIPSSTTHLAPMGRPTTPGREWRQRCQERRRSSPGNVLPPSMYGARACGAAGRICSLHGRTLLGAANAIHEGSCPYFGKMPNCDAQGRAYKKSSFPCLCTKTPPEFLGRLCPAP
jgi:hypothetical protein